MRFDVSTFKQFQQAAQEMSRQDNQNEVKTLVIYTSDRRPHRFVLNETNIVEEPCDPTGGLRS